MTLQERIAENSKKGYVYVGEVDGQELWKKKDKIATTYYLDEGYKETFPIWNTFRNPEILKLIYKDQKK